MSCCRIIKQSATEWFAEKKISSTDHVIASLAFMVLMVLISGVLSLCLGHLNLTVDPLYTKIYGWSCTGGAGGILLSIATAYAAKALHSRQKGT